MTHDAASNREESRDQRAAEQRVIKAKDRSSREHALTYLRLDS